MHVFGDASKNEDCGYIVVPVAECCFVVDLLNGFNAPALSTCVTVN